MADAEDARTACAYVRLHILSPPKKSQSFPKGLNSFSFMFVRATWRTGSGKHFRLQAIAFAA